MSARTTEDYYSFFDGIDPYERTPDSYREEHADDVEPWWERFYDERDDYDGCRDEVER